MAESPNLAGRAGRWSATHWKVAALGWFALTIGVFAIGSALGLNRLGDSQSGSGETARAESFLRNAHFLSPAGEVVLVQSRDRTPIAGTQRFTSAVASLVQTLQALPELTNIRSPLDPVHPGLVSKDRRSAIIQFDVRGPADKAADRVQPALDAVAKAQAGNPTFRIEEFGTASANHVIGRTVTNDFKRAELTSLP